MSAATVLAPPPSATAAREAFRAFADTHVVPYAAAWDQAGAIPRETLEKTAAEGYFGAVVPVEHGGTGGGWVAFSELHEEIGRGCSSLRSLLTVHSMALYALERWGSAAARQRLLAPMVAGELRGAFCLTEEGAGSDIAALRTTARRVEGGYVLDGRKLWSTGGQCADVLLVFARAERGVSAFVVEADRPGVRREPVHDMLGTRASMLAEFTFADCRVEDSALIGAEGFGLTLAAATLDVGRLSVGSGSVGIVQACLESSARHAAARVQGGGPIAGHQAVARMIALMAVDAEAARLLIREAARLKDAGDPATLAATFRAKYHASTAAMRAALDTVQIHGAGGCAAGADPARLFRDAKVMEIIEGSTQILEPFIAQDAVARFAPAAPGDRRTA